MSQPLHVHYTNISLLLRDELIIQQPFNGLFIIQCNKNKAYFTTITKPQGMQASIIRCLSLARINREGCRRKGIRHKNGGIDGGGATHNPDGVAPDVLLVHLPLLPFHASYYPEDSKQ